MKEFNLEQEITWLQEEIEQDEYVMNSSDRSDFHRERLNENRIKLAELLDLRKPNVDLNLFRESYSTS